MRKIIALALLVVIATPALAWNDKKGGEKMEDVVARMKAAQELEANESYQKGREAGESWARDNATPKQLRRLRSYVDLFQGQLCWDVDGHWNCLGGCTGSLALAIMAISHEDAEASDLEHFWGDVPGVST
jgi:hypothetical protein